MTIVNIKIKDINYQLSCGEGEEERIKLLADRVNTKISDLAKTMPRANDNLLFLMLTLIMEDKIEELENMLKDKIKSLPPDSIKEFADNSSVSASVDAISEYIENLALKLEKQYTL